MDRRRRLLTEKYSEPAHNPALRGLRSKIKKITVYPGVVSIAGSRVRGESTEDLDVIISIPNGIESQVKKAIEDVLGDTDVKVSDGRGGSRLPLWDLVLVPHRPLGLVAARQLEEPESLDSAASTEEDTQKENHAVS